MRPIRIDGNHIDDVPIFINRACHTGCDGNTNLIERRKVWKSAAKKWYRLAHYAQKSFQAVLTENAQLRDEILELTVKREVYDIALDILAQNACIGRWRAVEQAQEEIRKRKGE